MGVSATISGRFSLVDHHGRAVSQQSYGDRYMLVYFGFTHCRVVCPRALTKLSSMLDTLGERADRIVALYITVDPERDTPAVMKAYLEASHPRFTGLTGTTNQIAAARASFRVFAERKADMHDPDGYAVPHTSIAYLLAPSGQCLAHFTDSLDAERIAHKVSHLLDAKDAANHA